MSVPSPSSTFQSPCAGNMFGKLDHAQVEALLAMADRIVSIPVCGEHVW